MYFPRTATLSAQLQNLNLLDNDQDVDTKIENKIELTSENALTVANFTEVINIQGSVLGGKVTSVKHKLLVPGPVTMATAGKDATVCFLRT